MDAGCGTGLSGVLFRNMSEHLVGVDISRRMVQRAAERKIYDELSTGDMAEELTAHVRALRSRMRAANAREIGSRRMAV